MAKSQIDFDSMADTVEIGQASLLHVWEIVRSEGGFICIRVDKKGSNGSDDVVLIECYRSENVRCDVVKTTAVAVGRGLLLNPVGQPSFLPLPRVHLVGLYGHREVDSTTLVKGCGVALGHRKYEIETLSITERVKKALSLVASVPEENFDLSEFKNKLSESSVFNGNPGYAIIGLIDYFISVYGKDISMRVLEQTLLGLVRETMSVSGPLDRVVVISDIQKPFEVEALRAFAKKHARVTCTIVEIQRPGRVITQDPRVEGHGTETGLNPGQVDLVLVNDYPDVETYVKEGWRMILQKLGLEF